MTRYQARAGRGRMVAAVSALVAATFAIGSLYAAVPAGASAPASGKSASDALAHSTGHAQPGAVGQGGGSRSGNATGHFQAQLLKSPPVFTPAEKALQAAASNRQLHVASQSGNTAVPSTPVHVTPSVAHASNASNARSAGAAPGAPTAPTDFDTFRATDVTPASGGSASGVDEPSTANDGNVVLYTGNWYAALSTDSGNSFSYVNPYTLGPTPSLPNGGFCCDQATIHAPAVGGTDVTAWVLLYCQVSNNCNSGDNIIRLAVARNQADLASASFDYYDFSAQSFGFPEGYNLDYPHVSANNGYLNVSINVFDNNNNFYTSMMIHFDESSFTSGSYSYSFYYNNQDFTWTPTDNSHDTWTYWAATAIGNNSLIRVYYWPPNTDYTHVGWNDFSVGFNYEGRGGGSCAAPDGNNWCAFDDSRVKTGGEIGSSTAWFMWDAQQGNGAPNPYVEYASFDVSGGPASSVSPGYLAYNNTAVAYPGLGVDNAGNMALSVQFGGSSWGYPQSIIGIDDDVTGGWGTWYGYNGSASANTRWGDYLTARAAEYPSGTGNTWIATGFSLDASGNTHPEFMWVGRTRDDPWAPSAYYAYSNSFTEGAYRPVTTAITYGKSNCTCDYYAIDYWGDGGASFGSLSDYPGFPGYFNVSDAWTYGEEGSYTSTVVMNDYWGNSATQTGTSSVADAALTASGVSLSATQGSTLSAVVAHFSDADPNGTTSDYSATINWGDGSSATSGTIGSGFTVSGHHQYATPGSYSIGVSIADAGGATTSATSTVNVAHARPIITSVSPNVGPATGGNTVKIFGHYFTGATAVKFGTTPGTSVHVISSTSLTVTAPAHGASQVDVHVTAPGGTSTSVTADHYTFVVAPTVTKVSPVSGTHLGGTVVTITGSHFTNVTAVLFGTKPGTSIHVISSTSLTVTSPAHAVSTVDVHVKTAGGTSPANAQDKYKFV